MMLKLGLIGKSESKSVLRYETTTVAGIDYVTPDGFWSWPKRMEHNKAWSPQSWDSGFPVLFNDDMINYA